jgi:hypothetical protein
MHNKAVLTKFSSATVQLEAAKTRAAKFIKANANTRGGQVSEHFLFEREKQKAKKKSISTNCFKAT